MQGCGRETGGGVSYLPARVYLIKKKEKVYSSFQFLAPASLILYDNVILLRYTFQTFTHASAHSALYIFYFFKNYHIFTIYYNSSYQSYDDEKIWYCTRMMLRRKLKKYRVVGSVETLFARRLSWSCHTTIVTLKLHQLWTELISSLTLLLISTKNYIRLSYVSQNVHHYYTQCYPSKYYVVPVEGRRKLEEKPRLLCQ